MNCCAWMKGSPTQVDMVVDIVWSGGLVVEDGGCNQPLAAHFITINIIIIILKVVEIYNE